MNQQAQRETSMSSTSTVEFGGTEYEVTRVDSSVMEEINRSEVDQAIATARKFPRSMTGFVRKLREFACLNQVVADGCTYVLPRGGKNISGPSIRFAELVCATYGNLRVRSYIREEDDAFIVAQATAHDLESNNSQTIEVRRRITDRHGKRFADDMIGVTSNAAISIARRNAIFATVPRAMWAEVYEQTKRAALGSDKTMEQLRVEALRAFADLEVGLETLFAALGVKGGNDIGVDELMQLRQWYAYIRDGKMTVGDLAKPEPAAARAKKGEKSEAAAALLAGRTASGEKTAAAVVDETAVTAPEGTGE